ncbi:MAG: hypothetical protein HOO19_14220 [Rhodospirillaceae bacterium]|jgi:hypothetical protein|nr:hypothetical protein [Rhodospirillaceae bacterium]MBT3885482.1 hypothetical protein [Rhodospirillaceae bacterium]MBT4115848.1 hypothetical protein [Rhodospirillaceae bacterium]MBT4720209.1 hypothetical protein [Rhodospirillaceae bacterium]MBT4750485.1 hypothetical protein [Rhodospirillaceae bacterium]
MSEEKASTKTKSKTDAKTDAAKPAGDSSTLSSSDSGASSSSSQNKSASALSTSHFSSVRTAEYRAGWHDIFGGAKSNSRKKEAAAKPKPNGPVRIVLGNEDLSADLLRELEAALRKKARKDKIKLGRKSKSQQLNWRLTGEISG